MCCRRLATSAKAVRRVALAALLAGAALLGASASAEPPAGPAGAGGDAPPVVITAAVPGPAGARAPGGAGAALLRDPPGAREIDPAELHARPAPFAAPVGERLVYVFRYWGVPLGTTSLEVARYLEHRGRRLAHVVATARTYAAFDWLYRIDDRAEAWIDIDALRTVESRSWMEHRHRRIYEEIHYDWERHWVRVVRERRHSGRGRELVLDAGPFVHDPLGLAYTARSTPGLGDGVVELPVYADKKLRGLRLTPVETRTLDSAALGPVRALALHPEARLDGKPRGDEGHGLLWVAADATRLPLRLTGWFRGSDTFRIGGLVAELVEYTPHAPGWEGIAGPATNTQAHPAPRSGAATEAGVAIWSPPAAVNAARRAAGPRPPATRFHFPPQPPAQSRPYPRPEPTARRLLQPQGESATPHLPRGRAQAHGREGR